MSELAILALDRRATRVEAFADAWADAELDAGDALRAWCVAVAGARADAFAGYQAALEREERAARVLREAIEVQR